MHFGANTEQTLFSSWLPNMVLLNAVQYVFLNMELDAICIQQLSANTLWNHNICCCESARNKCHLKRY